MSCKDSIQFSISQVISITNSGSTCSESVCCASSTFNADTQFQLLETGVFTYGIVVLSSILGFVDATDFGVLSYTLNAAELMNSMITIDPFGATSNTLRIVKFIIIAVNDSSTTNPSSAFIDPSNTDPSTADSTAEASPESSSVPVVLGAVVGALVFVLLLIIAVIVLFVCICTRMKSTVKQNLEGMSYTIWKSGTGEVIMDPNSPTQLAEALHNNPSYKANTDFPIYAEVDATLIETMSHEYDTVTPDEQTQLSEPEDYAYDTVPDQPAEVEDPVLVYKGGEPEKGEPEEGEPEAGQPEEGEPEKGEREAGEADYCISDYETIEARCTRAGEQNPTEPEVMKPVVDIKSRNCSKLHVPR
ncbi:uncharacterized protein LOC135351521 [Halichondria panicea]|uniref:uncharacterized protein LOC135351521 n=1 Tax=Halichondria panicea TaxID=6063 RepID=UPI00312B2D17